jgi:magnesium chelatase subunit D
MSASLATPDTSALDADGAAPRWSDALLAARLFAVDPAGLGGIVLRAGPGPVRDLWNDYLRGLLPAGTPVKRMPITIEDDRLLGGVDLAATLRLGKPVVQSGILIEADGGIVQIPMAERLATSVGARIAAVLDRREVLIERGASGPRSGSSRSTKARLLKSVCPLRLQSGSRFISIFPISACGI